MTATRRNWLALGLLAIPALLSRGKPAKANALDSDIWTQPAAPGTATALIAVNESNDEAADYDPRGLVSVECSDTDHSAHITAWKARGTWANPQPVQVADYLSGYVARGYTGSGYERAGYYSHVVVAVSGGHLSTAANIKASDNGNEIDVYSATVQSTVIYAGGAQLVISNGGLMFYDANGVPHTIVTT
jgi:hypothetical protein